MIIYGTEKDCQGILKLLDEEVKLLLLYSDRKAESESYEFLGKKVIAPGELCKSYKDYNILVTSSFYSFSIQDEFDRMGVDPSRVFYNKAGFLGHGE